MQEHIQRLVLNIHVINLVYNLYLVYNHDHALADEEHIFLKI